MTVDGAEFAPGVRGILWYFRWAHLPPPLQRVSAPFATLAVDLAMATVERGADVPETIVALRSLLGAKDAAVRALVGRWPIPEGLMVDLLRDPPAGSWPDLVDPRPQPEAADPEPELPATP